MMRCIGSIKPNQKKRAFTLNHRMPRILHFHKNMHAVITHGVTVLVIASPQRENHIKINATVFFDIKFYIYKLLTNPFPRSPKFFFSFFFYFYASFIIQSLYALHHFFRKQLHLLDQFVYLIGCERWW